MDYCLSVEHGFSFLFEGRRRCVERWFCQVPVPIGIISTSRPKKMGNPKTIGKAWRGTHRKTAMQHYGLDTAPLAQQTSKGLGCASLVRPESAIPVEVIHLLGNSILFHFPITLVRKGLVVFWN